MLSKYITNMIEVHDEDLLLKFRSRSSEFKTVQDILKKIPDDVWASLADDYNSLISGCPSDYIILKRIGDDKGIYIKMVSVSCEKTVLLDIFESKLF